MKRVFLIVSLFTFIGLSSCKGETLVISQVLEKWRNDIPTYRDGLPIIMGYFVAEMPDDAVKGAVSLDGETSGTGGEQNPRPIRQPAHSL